ncbi:hypothetical protein FB446DRAFT_312834 [Lentinula raphanica]|nr:hypothetical protein FB446DRAFT_312834 [Lentinula raphanica]
MPVSTSPSADSSKIFTPRRHNLNRGRACRRCRIRKSKCDGQYPSCSQCLRGSRKRSTTSVACIYEAPQGHKAPLEDTLQKLEARLHQLEEGFEHDRHPAAHPSSSPITMPLLISDIDTNSMDSSFDMATIDALFASCGSCTLDMSPSPTSSGFGDSVPHGNDALEEPTSEISMNLIRAFLPHARSFGFFLDMDRFCESAALPLPIGHFSRPFPGLLSTVYLFGSYLSSTTRSTSSLSTSSESEAATDTTLLCRALFNVANTLSSSHPMRILHGIQAEILLAVFFFHTGRIIEGKYHLNSAVSLALCEGYHNLGTGENKSNVVLARQEMITPNSVPVFRSHFTSTSTASASIPKSVLEKPMPVFADVMHVHEEKVRAFWMTFALANCWGVVVGSMPSMVFEGHGERINTPWPRSDLRTEKSSYLPILIPPSSTESRCQTFLDHRPLISAPSSAFPSAMELYAKSSLLLERATQVAASYCSDPLTDEGRRFANVFASVDSLISDFFKNLPPFDAQALQSDVDFPIVLVTHTIVNTAAINLHAPFGATNPRSRGKALVAAHRCVELVRQTKMVSTVLIGSKSVPDLGSDSIVNPFFGPMWTAVCQIIIEEMRRISEGMINEPEGLNASFSTSHWVGAQNEGSDSKLSMSKQDLVRMLEEMLEVMGIIAVRCPLISEYFLCFKFCIYAFSVDL